MHVPADILRLIATDLALLGHRRTLANLCRANQEAYDACVPILYEQLEISAVGCAGLLDLTPQDVVGFPGFDKDGTCQTWPSEGDNFRRRSVLRRFAALSHTKRAIVRSLPPDHISTGFAEAAIAMGTPSGSLNPKGVYIFPRIQSVCLLAHAVDELRKWVPERYNRPRNPPFLEALSAGSRPRYLCIAFRLVPSEIWDVHRDLSSGGQYTLVRKVALLCTEWNLDSLTYHNIVHQVPPSVPGTRNVYQFAPHVVRHPLFARRYRFLKGKDAISLPGPDWNTRPWQMAFVVKGLFPSGADHMAILDRGTRWVFCDVVNHILSKEERDDDDSTGVWYAEVPDMIKTSLKVGMDGDLPARGVTPDILEEILKRIEYGKSERCEACGRESINNQG